MIVSIIMENNVAAFTSSIIGLDISLARAQLARAATSLFYDWWLKYVTRFTKFIRCCSRIESQSNFNFRSSRNSLFESGMPGPAYSPWSHRAKKSGIDEPVKDPPVPFQLLSLSFYEPRNHSAVLTNMELCHGIWLLCLVVSTGLWTSQSTLPHTWISPSFPGSFVGFSAKQPATEWKQSVCFRRINWPLSLHGAWAHCIGK